MPNTKDKDVAIALAQLTQNFIDSSIDRLSVFDQIIDDIYNERGDRGTLFQTLVNEIHSLKGSAGTFGFPFVSDMCHRLEDYLESSRRLEKEQWLEVQKFVDEFREIFETGKEPNEAKHDAILKSLPTSAVYIEAIDAMVLLVMEAGVIRKTLGTRLAEKGVNVSFAANSLQALKMALTLKPDMIAASQELAPISGIELSKALNVIEATKKISFILLTANKKLQAPKSMDVIYKDRKVADHILNILSHE